jgi:hypothetical protein
MNNIFASKIKACLTEVEVMVEVHLNTSAEDKVEVVELMRMKVRTSGAVSAMPAGRHFVFLRSGVDYA